MNSLCQWCLGSGFLEYGTGTEAGTERVRCNACKGDGVISTPPVDSFFEWDFSPLVAYRWEDSPKSGNETPVKIDTGGR
jgi:hypothetical protein